MCKGLCGAVLATFFLFLPTATFAQTARPQNTYQSGITDTSAKYAPNIHSDRTVTFSVQAPAASKVELDFEGPPPTPMTKDSDGIWRITVGPLPPDVYRYTFLIDGVATIDMSNVNVSPGRSLHRSLLDVPGTPARFDERQDVPHGALHIREYNSDVVKLRRRVVVYVPPGYDAEPGRRFPVLYLRHGNGDLESTWSDVGRAGDILDNLLAQQKAVRMLIAMPNGYPSARGAGNSDEGLTVTDLEVMREIIPFIERNYRVSASQESRAIAGLSMGATQALLTGLQHLDTFAWVAAFSSGTVGDADFKLETAVPGFLENQAARKSLRLLFLSCGTDDPRYAGHLDLVDTLKARNFSHEWYSTPGAHEWKVWRHSLADLLPRLFQPTPSARQ